MAYTLQQGSTSLEAETVDAMVKQIAARTFKFKQAVTIVPTSSLTNTFFREDPTILAGGANASIEGVPYGADFPNMSPKWEQATVKNIKFAATDNIAWEFIKGSAIDIMARKIIKVTEAVVKAVDDYIWGELTQDRAFDSSLLIQSFSISSDKYWNGTSAAIVYDLGAARRLIGEKNYETGNLIAFISPRDHQSAVDYLHSKGAQYNSLGEEMALNGRVAKVAGITLVESQSVSASFALVVVPKTCATYKEFESLKSTTINDPYKSVTIRVVEEGAIELTDPLAIVLIRGTQGVHQL